MNPACHAMVPQGKGLAKGSLFACSPECAEEVERLTEAERLPEGVR